MTEEKNYTESSQQNDQKAGEEVKQQQKKKKELQANDERRFYSRKYQLGNKYVYGFSVMVMLGFLVMNFITYITQRNIEERSKTVPELYNSVLFTHKIQREDLFTGDTLQPEGLFGALQALDRFFIVDYAPEVQDHLVLQKEFLYFYYGKNLFMFIDQVINIAISIYIFKKMDLDYTKIYIGIMTLLFNSDLNTDISIMHCVHFSQKIDQRKKKVYQGFHLVIRLVIPVFALGVFFIFFTLHFSKCIDGKSSNEQTLHLVEAINRILDTYGRTQEYYFGYDVIKQAQFINDNLTSCQATSSGNYLLSDPFRIYSIVQMLIFTVITSKKVFDVTCGKNINISYYNHDESSGLLVPLPNKQPLESFKLYKNGPPPSLKVNQQPVSQQLNQLQQHQMYQTNPQQCQQVLQNNPVHPNNYYQHQGFIANNNYSASQNYNMQSMNGQNFMMHNQPQPYQQQNYGQGYFQPNYGQIPSNQQQQNFYIIQTKIIRPALPQ